MNFNFSFCFCQAKSYTKISEKIGVSPRHIMFLTDIYEEAVAADEAGFRTLSNLGFLLIMYLLAV